MPLYDYECKDCGNIDRFVDSAQNTRAPHYACSRCNGISFRLYTPPQVACFTPYVTDAFDGQRREVRTAQQENDLCRRHNTARLLSTDEFNASKAKRRRDENAEKALPSFEESYERTRHELGIGRETTLADLTGVK